MTPLNQIADLLRVRVGLDVRTIGARALGHAVSGRAKARGIAGIAAYLAVLADDAAEWDALLEAIVVPETWFFRDREPFALLSRWAASVRTERDGREPLTALSLPCATGEEAWSIAIAFAAAGLPRDAFRIDALDLSQRALAAARTGLYAARALRGHRPDPAWERYLQTRADGRLEVAPELHGSVHFARGNLVEARRALAGRRFDCIFSRNLLIYCDDATRAAAVETFAELLRPDGLLFLGHAETLPMGTSGFVREEPPGAFAWRRSAATRSAGRRSVGAGAERETGGTTRRTQTRANATFSPGVATVSPPAPKAKRAARMGGPDTRLHSGNPSLTSPRPAAPTQRRPPGRVAAARQPENALDQARALADRGQLVRAAALAAERVAQAPGDAGAHELLGIVQAAQGHDREAAEHLRRALYLEPTREEALVHLALVLERRGERTAAARLRERAKRLESPR